MVADPVRFRPPPRSTWTALSLPPRSDWTRILELLGEIERLRAVL